MVKINNFSVEAWMDEHENNCQYNIAETCAASISIDELRQLSEDQNRSVFDYSKILNYGAIRGSDALRSSLARLYSTKTANPLPAENILTAPGAIAANYLCAYALVGPGDHVVCHYPTYQSLYEVPRQLGANVSLWKATPENDWIPSIDDLKSLITPQTKLIIINNPHNPTGAVLKKASLQQIIDIASEHDIIVMSDEVYRPLFHSITPIDPDFPPSILSMGYTKAIATGSMSKAYAMAGIRVGWIASRDRDIIETIAHARHYTTISVSALDEQVAAYALDPNTIHALLARNIQLAKTNLEIVEKFVNKNDDEVSWVKPLAGTTAFVKIERDGKPVDSTDFCKKLLASTGVLLVPGDLCFGDEFKGYVRVGYVNQTHIIKEGMDKVSKFVRKELDNCKLADE